MKFWRRILIGHKISFELSTPCGFFNIPDQHKYADDMKLTE